MSSDEHPEAAHAPSRERLVVLTPALGEVAATTSWIRGDVEGLRLVVIPVLRVMHIPAMMIAGGTGLGPIFKDSSLQMPTGVEIAGFVGGAWKLWKTGQPELHGVGFVLGEPMFDIERAVRGVTKLLA